MQLLSKYILSHVKNMICLIKILYRFLTCENITISEKKENIIGSNKSCTKKCYAKTGCATCRNFIFTTKVAAKIAACDNSSSPSTTRGS